MGNLFYGPYMRVWMPAVLVEKHTETCTNPGCSKHMKNVDTPYCPACGAKVDVLRYNKESEQNLHDFLEEKFNDCDMFQVVYPDDGDYVLAVPNRTSDQGGRHFEDDSEIEIIDLLNNKDLSDFVRNDWVKFEAALQAADIKYEKKLGVLKWSSK